MASFPLKKWLMITRGVAECFLVFFRLKWRRECFYHSLETRRLFYLFYKITKVFPTSSMSLYSNTKLRWRQLCLCTLRENKTRLIRACAGRVSFYKSIEIVSWRLARLLRTFRLSAGSPLLVHSSDSNSSNYCQNKQNGCQAKIKMSPHYSGRLVILSNEYSTSF